MSSACARAVLAPMGTSQAPGAGHCVEREAGAGHRLPEARQTLGAVRVTAETGSSDTEPNHWEGE